MQNCDLYLARNYARRFFGIICSEKGTVASENIRLIIRVFIVFVLLNVIIATEQAKK